MPMRRIHLLPFIVAAVFASGAAGAQDFRARVLRVNQDRMTVDAARGSGIEVGDILVIQDNGAKKGLVKITSTNPDYSVGQMIIKTPGESFAPGDTAAFQLLTSGAGHQRGARNTPLTTAEELLPDTFSDLPPWLGEYNPVKGGSGERPAPKTVAPPKPPEGRAYLGYSDTWRADAEISKWKSQLNKRPGDRRAMYTLGDLYFQKDRFEESAYWNQRAVEADPDAPDNDKILFQIASAYARMGLADKANLYMEHIRKRYPNSVFALEQPIDAWTTTYEREHGYDYVGDINAGSGQSEFAAPRKLGDGATLDPLNLYNTDVKKGKMKIFPLDESNSTK